MSEEFVYSPPPNYTRAPTEYRECLLKFVSEKGFTSAEMTITPLTRGTAKRVGTFEILGRTFWLEMETYGGTMDFVKVRPVGKDGWGAYWRRGKGMKVYGDYVMFENDIVLLKTAT